MRVKTFVLLKQMIWMDRLEREHPDPGAALVWLHQLDLRLFEYFPLGVGGLEGRSPSKIHFSGSSRAAALPEPEK